MRAVEKGWNLYFFTALKGLTPLVSWICQTPRVEKMPTEKAKVLSVIKTREGDLGYIIVESALVNTEVNLVFQQ